MHPSLFNVLILFGAVNALIFSIILLFQKKHPGSKFLAAFIFVVAYNGFETYSWSAGLNYLFFDMCGFIVIYAIGPSLYLYVTSLLYPELKSTGRQIVVHYGFVIFQFVSRVAVVVYHLLWINKIIVNDVHSMQLMNIMWAYAEWLSVLVFLIYLYASIHTFRKFNEEQLKAAGKDRRQAVNRWVNSLLWCMTAFGVGWVLTVLSPDVFSVSWDIHYYPIELSLVLFTYWVVLNGYHKVKLITYKPLPPVTGVANTDAQRHFEQLRCAMEVERLYLDPELNLTKVASHTGIPSKTISSILNQHHGTSFNDFVNDYRVKEVSKRMIDPVNQHFTISGLALESGFNSQATFQRVFKSSTGMSPREYMNLYLKKTG